MATLTYDPSESQPGELNADEQESLQVGEQMEQEQQALLAGKFKDAEDLEKAYIELQSKLGKNEPAEESKEEEQQEEPAEKEAFLERLWNEAKTEYSQETLEELKGMKPEDVAQMYLEYRNQNQQPEKVQISNEDAQSLRQMVGGDEAYTNMVQWAAKNLNEQAIGMYDSVMNSGDPAAMYFAVQALRSMYTDNVGQDGQLITGKAAASKETGFRSQAELVRAMSDPRYDTDPAYRQDVTEKLERSNLQF